jgi:hypothetical protein
MEATGQELVTDGEQRASSFATYPITESASIYHPERWASADIELPVRLVELVLWKT